jgi:ABC-type nickel/cobalt efflux system permease component RcnA
VPRRVDSTDPDGVDFGWVMQVTFVGTIVVGAPLVALLSTTTTLPTWGARAAFAVRVGALVWFVTALVVYAVARRRAAVRDDGSTADGRDAE